MRSTFKILSALLSYPTAELQAAIPELRKALDAERALPQRQRDRLDRIMDELADGDLYDLQERYVLLFDRTRSLSLHLFEHVHGESRDRGQAMVDLGAHYARFGFEMRTSELPDYLPLFLEFLSLAPPEEAGGLMGETAHVFETLRQRLKKCKSTYSSVLSAAMALGSARPQATIAASVAGEPIDDPNDLAALDEAWMDEEVRFAPPQTACGKDDLGAKLRAARRPAPGMPPAAPKRPIVTINGAPRS
jgi:nitrate reductase molybdenum cofactor assembly chaperone NarJ/NarW